MTEREKVIKLVKERPVDIVRKMGFTLLHEIDENGYSLHNEWLKLLIFSKEEILLQAHRESFKTTCVIGAIAISMIILPTITMAFLRKTDKDIKEVMNAVRKCLMTDVAIWLAYQLWDMELTLAKESTEEITTSLFLETRGSAQLTGMGIGSSIVGKHYDKIFTDDICTNRDRVSRAEREATKTGYRELGNILNDKIKGNPFSGVIINTGTPWHKNDVFLLMPPPLVWDYTQTGILSDEFIAGRKRTLTKSEFAANYELKHISDADKPFGEPKFTTDKARIFYGYAQLDCAFGGDNYTALTIMNKDYQSELYYGFGIVWNQHVNKCYPEILALLKEYKVDITFIEDNADKGYVAEELEQLGVFVKIYHENSKKYVKILTYLNDNWDKIFWHKETDPEYLTQIVDYEMEAEPDDAPDSAASLLREFAERQEAFII
jgi:hypothetical protein